MGRSAIFGITISVWILMLICALSKPKTVCVAQNPMPISMLSDEEAAYNNSTFAIGSTVPSTFSDLDAARSRRWARCTCPRSNVLIILSFRRAECEGRNRARQLQDMKSSPITSSHLPHSANNSQPQSRPTRSGAVR